MSGEKNSGEEIIYKLSTNKKFTDEVVNIRKNAEMPIGGFFNEEKLGKWFDKHINDAKDAQIIDAVNRLSKNYSKSILYSDYFLEYLLFGRTNKKRTDFIEVIPPSSLYKKNLHDIIDFHTEKNEDFLEKNDEPYVKVLILKTGTKTDIVKALKEKWSAIEELFAKQGLYRRERIRKTVYKKRNLRIKELCKKPIKELRELSGNSLGEKDSCIADILNKEGKGIGNVKPGYVRKICGT